MYMSLGNYNNVIHYVLKKIKFAMIITNIIQELNKCI